MNLRRVALLFSLFLVLVLSAFLLAYRWFVEIPKLRENLEFLQTRELTSLDVALKKELSFFRLFTWDYAIWDDTYDFLINRNSDYLISNYQADTFESLKVDSVFLFDASKQVVWSKSLKYDEQNNRRFTEFLASDVVEQVRFPSLMNITEQNVEHGFLDTQFGPVLYAISPVVKSDFSVPANGYLMFLRIIRPKFIQGLGDLAQLDVKWVDTPVNHSLKPLKGSLQGESFEETRYRALTDHKGKPVLTLLIHHEKLPKLRLFDQQTLLLVLLLLAFAFVLQIIIEKVLVVPIGRAAQALRKMTKTGDYDEIKQVSLVEEFVNLAEDFNRLIGQIKTQKQALQKLSTTDVLTQLANRRAFDTGVELAWQRTKRANQPLAIIMADIDLFKPYNDHYGHQAGDKVLAEVAKALSATFARSTDLVARYGGEEFVIVLEDIHQEDCRKLVEQCLQNIRDLKIPHQYSTTSDCVSISIGFSVVENWLGENPPTSQSQLLERADQALYQAKNSGRNCYREWKR